MMKMESKYPIKTMMDRYGFYRQRYVMMRKDVVNCIDSKYTTRQMWEHLNGNMSLCVFAGPHNTVFLSIDIDMKDADVVHKVIDTMVELGIPKEKIYVSDSGGKGYHVDIFFANSIYNWRAKELYELVIYFGELDRRKVEYRPTKSQAIKLPLGVHQKTGNRCWFVDRDTLVPIEDFNYIDRTEKIEVYRIEQIIKEGNLRRFYIMLEEAKNSEQTEQSGSGKRYKKISPSNITIDVAGTRQQCMVKEALRLYRAGGEYPDIHKGLEAWLDAQDPAMYKDSWQECLRNIDNISAWVMRCGRRKELGEDLVHEFHNNIHIYESDARHILKAPTKNSRMFAFLITLFCDKYGFCGLSEKKIGDILSVRSNKTVSGMVKKISKMFWITPGGYNNRGDSLKRVTNKYRFHKDHQRTGRSIEINDFITSENIYGLYIRMLAEFCSDIELAKDVTLPELKDVRAARKEIEHNGREQDKAG